MDAIIRILLLLSLLFIIAIRIVETHWFLNPSQNPGNYNRNNDVTSDSETKQV